MFGFSAFIAFSEYDRCRAFDLLIPPVRDGLQQKKFGILVWLLKYEAAVDGLTIREYGKYGSEKRIRPIS